MKPNGHDFLKALKAAFSHKNDSIKKNSADKKNNLNHKVYLNEPTPLEVSNSLLFISLTACPEKLILRNEAKISFFPVNCCFGQVARVRVLEK